MTQARTLWPPPPPMDPAEAEQALAELRAAYAGCWHVWRSRPDLRGIRWWYASLRHPAAGVDLTAWARGPDELRAVLEWQRQERQRLPGRL